MLAAFVVYWLGKFAVAAIRFRQVRVHAPMRTKEFVEHEMRRHAQAVADARSWKRAA